MWPKMLFELLPHFARLVPMADMFLASRSTNDKAQEAALAALGDRIQRDIGQVAESHAAMQRTLQEQGSLIAEIAVEGTRVRLGVESIETRVARLENTAANAMKLLAAATVLSVGTVVLLVFVLLHLSHR